MNKSKQPKVSQVFCDKLTVTVKEDEAEDREILLEGLEWLVKKQRAQRRWKGRIYQHSFAIDVSEDPGVATELLVQCYPRYQTASFARLEWNPAKADMAKVQTVAEVIFPAYGYEHVVRHGKCTRADITVDLHGVDINQLLLWYPGLRRSYILGDNGKLETYVLGSRTSPLHFCAYDKRKESQKGKKKKGGPPLPPETINKAEQPPWTRIEAVVKEGLPFRNLPYCLSPFSNLGLASFPLLGSSSREFRYFLKACRAEGPQNLLCAETPKRRKMLQARLTKASPKWWDADKVWTDWPLVATDLTKHKPSFTTLLALKHQANVKAMGCQI